jgi:dipeptidase E
LAEILLLSNSTARGRAFLEHAHGAIAEVLQGRDRLLFIALAASDPDRYTQVMRESLAPIGIRVDSADTAADPCAAIAGAEAVSSVAVTASGC